MGDKTTAELLSVELLVDQKRLEAERDAALARASAAEARAAEAERKLAETITTAVGDSQNAADWQERAEAAEAKLAEVELENEALRQQIGGPKREAFNEALMAFDPTHVGRNYLVSAKEMVDRASAAEANLAKAIREYVNHRDFCAKDKAAAEAREKAHEWTLIRLLEAAEHLDSYVDFNESNLDAEGDWCSGPPDEPMAMDEAWLAFGREMAGARAALAVPPAQEETP